MNNQLSLIKRLFKNEEQEYSNSKTALRVIRDIKYLKEKLEGTMGYMTPYDEHWGVLDKITSDVGEALTRAHGLFYLVSSELPEFKGKNLHEATDMIDVIPQYSSSQPLSLTGVYNLSRKTQKSCERQLNTLHKDFKITEAHEDLQFYFNFNKNKILTCLTTAKPDIHPENY